MLYPIDTIVATFLLIDSCLRAQTPGEEARVAAEGVLVLAAALLGAFLLPWLGSVLARMYCRRRRVSSQVRQGIGASVMLAARILVVVLYAGVLYLGAWPVWLLAPLGGRSFLIECFAGISLYVLLCVASWTVLYGLHREISPGRWTMATYLLHRIRYSFFVFGAFAPLFVWLVLSHESLGIAAELPASAERISIFLLIVITAWTMPLFLRFFWGCRKLGPGPVRDRIAALAEQTGVRFSETFVWDLGGGALLNAAAVGFLPPFRYLFLSRALLAHLPPEELDGVICHEMGHIRHRHLVFYVVFTFAVMCALQMLFAGLTVFDESLAVIAAGSSQIYLTILFLVIYFRFGFGFLSRRMERQADLYALEVLGDPAPLCRALERLGLLSGNLRMASSWHHLSIAERVAFLRQASRSPSLAQAHHGQVARLKSAGYAFCAIILLFTLSDALREDGAGARRPARDGRRESLVRHQQRARYFLSADEKR